MMYVSQDVSVGRALLTVLSVICLTSCSGDPGLHPDDVLRLELGLGDRDQVHRVVIRGGDRESADPLETVVTSGSYVEFVTADWLVHEIVFELDSLSIAARTFLERTDQVASPPLISQDSRYVVHFADGPPGRYPFVLEGNGAPGRGVVVVEAGP
ncbi:MAG TPA: hypothetical protein EYO91_03415 [Gemmatimonadetes bacterium]|nr:hypothetical protein [Gemmatimonadota bacterium]HIA99541.1 hypothetical protein [Gemmatimonadota bacterium]HIC63255.1 hypothetical protein [Gemmatimonadota bacterium]